MKSFKYKLQLVQKSQIMKKISKIVAAFRDMEYGQQAWPKKGTNYTFFCLEKVSMPTQPHTWAMSPTGSWNCNSRAQKT